MTSHTLADGLSAQDIITHLNLAPHPEGGYFRETFRDAARIDGRSASTAIYYLLAEGNISHWHRIDAVEVWHYYAGAPSQLLVSEDAEITAHHTLGADLSAGQCPQIIVPKYAWQSTVCLGAWTLFGCTVAPGFEFNGFEMAPPDWAPADRQ